MRNASLIAVYCYSPTTIRYHCVEINCLGDRIGISHNLSHKVDIFSSLRHGMNIFQNIFVGVQGVFWSKERCYKNKPERGALEWEKCLEREALVTAKMPGTRSGARSAGHKIEPNIVLERRSYCISSLCL